MYAVFVNDIFNVTCSTKYVLYANDTVIILSAKSIVEWYTHAVNYFALYSKWFSINRLCLNDSKTHFMILGLNNVNENQASIKFDNHVHRVNEVHYLGIIIDDKLCWKPHINCIRDKLAQGIGMLKICYSIFPRKCLLTIYYSFVLPYLQNGIEFWGSMYSYLEPLRGYLHSIRLLCHVGKYTHCAPLAYSLGLLLLDDLHSYSLACLMFKVTNNLTPEAISNMFVKSDSIHSYSTRAHSSRYFVPQSSHFACVKFIEYQ